MPEPNLMAHHQIVLQRFHKKKKSWWQWIKSPSNILGYITWQPWAEHLYKILWHPSSRHFTGYIKTSTCQPILPSLKPHHYCAKKPSSSQHSELHFIGSKKTLGHQLEKPEKLTLFKIWGFQKHTVRDITCMAYTEDSILLTCLV